MVGITALKKKGLRHHPLYLVSPVPRWNHRPEEEGITTPCRRAIGNTLSVGITALKKKGLRPVWVIRMYLLFGVGITALKKKGLRPPRHALPA
mgnify:CR=1 FL=1